MDHWKKAIEEAGILIGDLGSFDFPDSPEFNLIIDEIKEACGSLMGRTEMLVAKMQEQADVHDQTGN